MTNDINNEDLINNNKSYYDENDMYEFSQSWNELEKADIIFDKDFENNVTQRKKDNQIKHPVSDIRLG
jgi:hypothetical protein